MIQAKLFSWTTGSMLKLPLKSLPLYARQAFVQIHSSIASMIISGCAILKF